MEIIIIGVVILLCGVGYGYYNYRQGMKQDEKRLAALYTNAGEEKKFRVKIRPVWNDDPEDVDTIITFDIMAPDETEAETYAYSFLDPRVRSHSYETIEVIELSNEG